MSSSQLSNSGAADTGGEDGTITEPLPAAPSPGTMATARGALAAIRANGFAHFNTSFMTQSSEAQQRALAAAFDSAQRLSNSRPSSPRHCPGRSPPDRCVPDRAAAAAAACMGSGAIQLNNDKRRRTQELGLVSQQASGARNNKRRLGMMPVAGDGETVLLAFAPNGEAWPPIWVCPAPNCQKTCNKKSARRPPGLELPPCDRSAVLLHFTAIKT